MSGVTIPDASITLLLKDEDRYPGELEHLQRAELESLRSAIESVLARRATEASQLTRRSPDVGFSCEWWPPD